MLYRQACKNKQNSFFFVFFLQTVSKAWYACRGHVPRKGGMADVNTTSVPKIKALNSDCESKPQKFSIQFNSIQIQFKIFISHV